MMDKLCLACEYRNACERRGDPWGDNSDKTWCQHIWEYANKDYVKPTKVYRRNFDIEQDENELDLCELFKKE